MDAVVDVAFVGMRAASIVMEAAYRTIELVRTEPSKASQDGLLIDLRIR